MITTNNEGEAPRNEHKRGNIINTFSEGVLEYISDGDFEAEKEIYTVVNENENDDIVIINNHEPKEQPNHEEMITKWLKRGTRDHAKEMEVEPEIEKGNQNHNRG